MLLKGLIDEDFVNYKHPSMTIAFPYCSFKCDKECGKQVCQNGTLANSPNIEYSVYKIYQRYIHNPITSAIVLQGLEPFDSFEDLLSLVKTFRDNNCNDDIVIYTGYNKKEIQKQIHWLEQYPNIIIKFGRFIPDQKSKYDDVLGITLASDNQYAEKIS